jgi:hypothetical protein
MQPVDVLVASLTKPNFDGRVLAALKQLSDCGAIRVLDAVAIQMAEDRSISRLVLDGEFWDERALGFTRADGPGLLDNASLKEFTIGMEPGEAAVALAIENTWIGVVRGALSAVGADMAIDARMASRDAHEAFGAGAWAE